MKRGPLHGFTPFAKVVIIGTLVFALWGLIVGVAALVMWVTG